MKKLRLLFICAIFSASLMHSSAEAKSNHMGLFLGATNVVSTTYFTTGLDYEYRLNSYNQMFGIGGILEFGFASHLVTIIAASFNVHPWMDLKITLAPGLEFASGHNAFLFRTGLGWDFHAGDYTITPTFALDFVSGHVAKVFGVTFGYGF